jgi:hypothetical protein
MGWARTLFLGDIGNRLDIGDNEDQIRKVREELRKNRRLDASQEERITFLEQENEQLEMLVSALARLLAVRGILDQDELEPFIAALDEEPDDAPPTEPA